MQRVWMQFALFINRITPVHFCIAAALYALALSYSGLNNEVPIFVATVVITLATVGVLKLVFRVQRPTDAVVRLDSQDRAFPSGHAASSALVAIIVPYTLQNTLSLMTIGAAAGVLAFGAVLVSASRLTLKVHTPFQVLIGLVIGVLLPLVCIYYLTPPLAGLF